MTPTCVYDSYWKFAAERQAVYLRRTRGEAGPWTDNPILRNFRFTNPFRAADRVSQYLISEIQYRDDRPQNPKEIFFRTILFKLFNKISTWQLLERELGPISWQAADFDVIDDLLNREIDVGNRIYSAAYIMPAPRLGKIRKHSNHLRLIQMMMMDGLPSKIESSKNLGEIYDFIKLYPGIGPFLAFQYSIDLNYSSFLEFDEGQFVVAGPGALDGISKCFVDVEGKRSEEIIYEMVDIQEAEFNRLGLDFDGLFGRKLQPIDCQNLFCEISKFARVAHPEVSGISGRTRIKQGYRPNLEPLATPVFPPRWGLVPPPAERAIEHGYQLALWN